MKSFSVSEKHKDFRRQQTFIQLINLFLRRTKKVVKVPDHIKTWITQKRNIFPILSFIIPLAIRAIPEILMGPFIIGFDTMGFYVPNTLLWLHNGVNIGSLLATAPLFYVILMSIVAAGGPMVIVLKIIPPFLLGFLSLSMYGYAKKGLNWSPSKSAFVAILGTVYFVALRASWDQLREELGLVFFFAVLILLINSKGSPLKRLLALSLAMMGVVLSHQLVSVLMFGVIVFTIAQNLCRKEFGSSTKVFLVSLPSILYFFVVYLSGVVQSGFLNYSTNVGSPLSSWTGFTSYQSMLIDTGGFFVYCFLLILPIAVISIWRLRNLHLRVWLFFSFILMLLPIASVSPFRWVLMLVYPIAFYATETLSGLKSIKWKHCVFNVRRIVILYLVLSTAILSFGFIFMTSENPFVYFNPQYVNYNEFQIPTSMLQNTISITDCQNTATALQWFKTNENSSAILLTHIVFYSWALLMFNEDQIRNYGFDSPDHAASTAAQEGHTQIFLIWWINGQGWYNQPTLSLQFHEVYRSGNIEIYGYK